MRKIKQLIVSINFGDEAISVGELVLEKGRIYFKFYADFLKRPLDISPFKLPLVDGIQQADTPIFDGLFGVFSDSLPDG